MPLAWCSSRASYRPPVKRSYNPFSDRVRTASHSLAVALRTPATGSGAGSFRPASKTKSMTTGARPTCQSCVRTSSRVEWVAACWRAWILLHGAQPAVLHWDYLRQAPSPMAAARGAAAQSTSCDYRPPSMWPDSDLGLNGELSCMAWYWRRHCHAKHALIEVDLRQKYAGYSPAFGRSPRQCVFVSAENLALDACAPIFLTISLAQQSLWNSFRRGLHADRATDAWLLCVATYVTKAAAVCM